MYFRVHNCMIPSNDYAAVRCSNNNQARFTHSCIRDQSYLMNQARYEVWKPYKCYRPLPHAMDVSHDLIIDMLYVPGDSFSKVGGLKKKTVENTKTKTVEDVDQQMVQRVILNGVPESDVPTQTCQSCHDVPAT